jgi:hypothetical protein
LEAWRWYLASVRQLPHSFESETQKVWLMLIIVLNQELMTFKFGQKCLIITLSIAT